MAMVPLPVVVTLARAEIYTYLEIAYGGLSTFAVHDNISAAGTDRGLVMTIPLETAEFPTAQPLPALIVPLPPPMVIAPPLVAMLAVMSIAPLVVPALSVLVVPALSACNVKEPPVTLVPPSVIAALTTTFR